MICPDCGSTGVVRREFRSRAQTGMTFVAVVTEPCFRCLGGVTSVEALVELVVESVIDPEPDGPLDALSDDDLDEVEQLYAGERPALLVAEVRALRERLADLEEALHDVCPACRGTGMMPAGFYPETCRACSGRGVTSTHALPEDDE